MTQGRPRDGTPWSLYLHVPFCRSKCAYCDFFSIPLTGSSGEISSLSEAFISALLRHARFQIDQCGVKILDSVYIGGGTPTCLAMPYFRELMHGVRSLIGSSPLREWTVEANPESLDQDHLFCMQESGVTRISLGVQDMSDAVLMASGRLSSKRDDILKSLDLLGSSWKGQKSADFICGLPGQSPEAFCRGLLRALDAGLDHVSLYDLTLEESSPLLNAMNSGHVPALDEDCLAELKSSARELLSDHGFTRYEVSNYSRSGGESVHNRHYWSMDAWIASGPGSSGSIPLADGTTERTICLADLDSFCLDPLSATRIELIDRRTASFEYIMMGIRTIWGIDRKGFMDRFQIGIETVIGASLKSWNGRIIKTEGAYVPNQDALDHLNAFLRECLSEMDRTWPA